MTKSINLTILILVIAFPLQVLSQEEQVEPETNLTCAEQAERFMNLIQEGKYRESVDVFFSNNPWMLAQPDQLATVKAQMSGLSDLLGELHGYDLIHKQGFGDSFVYMLFVAKFDRSPVSFHLSFYRPKDQWMAYTMEYKEDLLPLAQELSKMKLTMPALSEEEQAANSSSEDVKPL